MQTLVRNATRDRLPLRLAMIFASVSLLCLAAFHLGSEAVEQETGDFDRAFLAAAGALRQAHPWLVEVLRDVSSFGSMVSLTLFTVVGCGYLVIRSSALTALVLITFISASSLSVQILKAAFGRARPALGEAAFLVPGFSFPSGHTTMSAAVFLTLGALLAHVHARRVERFYIAFVAVVLTMMVGASRVALGVHWATDVVGGWLFGIAWASLALVAAHAMERRFGARRGGKRPGIPS